MTCEYCHCYTLNELKKTSNILFEIRNKLKITKNVELVCERCYAKFKNAEKLHIQNTILFD